MAINNDCIECISCAKLRTEMLFLIVMRYVCAIYEWDARIPTARFIRISFHFFFPASKDSVEKLEQHLKLLKAEYTKLQKNYAELERKYSKVAAANGENGVGEFSSFVSRLAMTVATLYGRKTYSDITLRLSDKTVPGHKFVLNARSEEWSEDVLADTNELGK